MGEELSSHIVVFCVLSEQSDYWNWIFYEA